MADNFDQDYAVGEGWSRWIEKDGYACGAVFTRHGIVEVYHQPKADKYPAFITLAAIKDGQFYYRKYKRDYSRRYTVTLAKRFARVLADV